MSSPCGAAGTRGKRRGIRSKPNNSKFRKTKSPLRAGFILGLFFRTMEGIDGPKSEKEILASMGFERFPEVPDLGEEAAQIGKTAAPAGDE